MKAINAKKLNTQLAKILIIVLIISTCIIIDIRPVQAVTMLPNDSQYLEMRAVEIKEIEGNGKQLLFELWANDIDFKGFDVRFSYDSTNYNPSNLTTNVETDNETEYFAFESEFAGKLDMFTVPYSGDTSGIRMVISFNPPVDDSENIQNETLISSGKSVLLGKMSFKMTADEFDISGFKLIPDSTASPTTGIKINIDIENCYEDQSTFIFTDKTASKDATLKDIKLSSGIEDTDNPDNSTYKEYSLTPTFEKDTKEYTLELNEYIDEMNLEVELNDEKSSMKMKVPKRDEDGKLVYDTDGSTIIYEEKDLLNKTKTPVTLNKLGEPDTIIEIIVTAEDGKTQETYKITIHRPYGVIKGSISTPPTSSTTGKNIATIRIYKSDDVSSIIDWSTTVSGGTDDIHEKLLTLESQNYITNDDGTYEIYVIPKTYDILLDKTGYLDHIYTSKVIQEGTIMDLGSKELIPGDINKDGSIQILDLSELMNVFGIYHTDSNYNLKYDFNEDGEVQILDLSFIMSNFSETREIE